MRQDAAVTLLFVGLAAYGLGMVAALYRAIGTAQLLVVPTADR